MKSENEVVSKVTDTTSFAGKLCGRINLFTPYVFELFHHYLLSVDDVDALLHPAFCQDAVRKLAALQVINTFFQHHDFVDGRIDDGSEIVPVLCDFTIRITRSYCVGLEYHVPAEGDRTIVEHGSLAIVRSSLPNKVYGLFKFLVYG